MQLTYLFVTVSLAFATLVSGHVRNRGHMGAVSGHGHVDPMSCLDVDASKEPNLQLWRCLPWPNTHQWLDMKFCKADEVSIVLMTKTGHGDAFCHVKLENGNDRPVCVTPPTPNEFSCTSDFKVIRTHEENHVLKYYQLQFKGTNKCLTVKNPPSDGKEVLAEDCMTGDPENLGDQLWNQFVLY